MLMLSILLIFLSFFFYMTIVVDMFKRKTWLGFLGLFLFPFTFYHLFKNYTGNKKLMGALLLISLVFPLLYMQYENRVGDKELSPFFLKVREANLMECVKTSKLSSGGGITSYQVMCFPENIDAVKYTSEKELIANYKESFVIPALLHYKETFGLVNNKGVVLGIASPSKLYACYEIENPDKIVSEWSSFDACD